MKKSLLKLYYASLNARDYLITFQNKCIATIISPPVVKSTDETLTKIVDGRCSVSRYGDGEFSLMYGESLMFQPYSKKLGNRLKQIINSQQEQHIVCIPDVFKSVNQYTEKSNKYWTKYLSLKRNKIYKLLNKKKEYYDALVTRLYIDHVDKGKSEDRFNRFKSLWDKRDVVIVEGEKTRLGLGNDLFANTTSVQRIICPSLDAFSKYDEILSLLKRTNHSKLILISLGPTATVLAYDLAAAGYHAVDIGHIDIEYEWFLQKAREKKPVKNKYIGEVTGGANVGEISDQKYETEIIAKLI